MKRRSLLVPAIAVLAACSYYDNALLKFSPDEPSNGGSGGAGASAGVAGSSGGSAGTDGGRGGQAGADGGQSGSGAAGNTAVGGAAGSAGAGAGGATGGSAGLAGSAGNAAGQSGSAGSAGGPLACTRVTLPPRPVGMTGGAAGAAGMAGTAGSAGSAGAAGANGGASGTSGAAGTGGTDGIPGFPAEGLVFAMRTLDFAENQKPEESTLGFDLDGACTCLDTQVETCTTVKPRATLCDGPGGRDNSFPRLYKDLITFGFADSSTAISKDLDSGRYTVLLRIQNYNGLPDDNDVKLSFYVGGDSPSPEWDGKDEWTVLSTSVTDGDLEKPRVVDASAYVTGGVLVASIPTFDENDDRVVVQLNEKFAVALTGAVIVAKIDTLLGRWRITQGTLSGRWRDKDFFEYFSTYRAALEQPTQCTDGIFYPQIKNTFCSYADVSGSMGDVTGACTAMSIATRFTAQVALLGAIQPVIATPPSTCPPATNPATDSCSK